MEVEKRHRYDLVERIAAGGMGEVFRARATGPHGFEKILAVKRILPELSSDGEFVDRFVRESKLAVSLSHANIVQVFDLGRSGNDLFLVMEYVHGTDLARLLTAARVSGRQIPIAIALLIIAESAQGLAYAHGRFDLEDGGEGPLGVIHCDISPSNLLLSYAGEVKLTDFGVAQLLDHTRRRPTEAQGIMGKWRYMAPEQIRGEQVDGRTDLYALGVVLYELLSGRRAFSGDGIKATCDLVLSGETAPLRAQRPEVSEELERFVTKVMSVDPERRPKDAREFLTQLTEIQRALSPSEQVTALDLGALVRELVPPPPDAPSKPGLSALFAPMVVEKTGETGSVVRRRKPAASFVAQIDETNSEAITQWIPAETPGWSFLSGARPQAPSRWRFGLVISALVLAALLAGVFTGLRLRRDTTEKPKQETPKDPKLPEEAVVVVPPPKVPPVIPQQPAAPQPDAGAERALRRPPVAPRGYLNIYVEPWANVTIDGKAQDKPTPLTNVAVRPGTHHLVLYNPVLNVRKELNVTVPSGQTQKVEVYLKDK